MLFLKHGTIAAIRALVSSADLLNCAGEYSRLNPRHVPADARSRVGDKRPDKIRKSPYVFIADIQLNQEKKTNKIKRRHACVWERQTFVCWYQSLFGSGNVTLPPDLRARDGSDDGAEYVSVPHEPEPKYGPDCSPSWAPPQQGVNLPGARHLFERTQMTDLLPPRPRAHGCILGNSASALLRKSTSQATSWHLAPPLCKIRPQRPIKKREKSPKLCSTEEGAPKREALHLSRAASNRGGRGSSGVWFVCSRKNGVYILKRRKRAFA